MIRAIPSIASDNVYCTLLAHSAVHGAMAGYTGFTVGPVNGRHAYIPFNRITEKQNKVVITDRMWARLLSSTNQPSFLNPRNIAKSKQEKQPTTDILDSEMEKTEHQGRKTILVCQQMACWMWTIAKTEYR
ncbi:ATP-dependent 6-phosphofructokinase 7-like [Hibiscus syriacus]|uniref:ATP-dependent 6-phosphofructokinase 7-like n=1 Tax=Hibiscus syriacus TaxID=106335 RepID=UPI001920EDB6|nr:ATP-dependent 6-phosphofructokinase 7-like [Hibiscus syriacus]